MQIVIDIDDNLYTRLFDNGGEYVADMRRACVAIRNGVSLPKGHGRLIDADALNFADIDSANYGSNFIRIAPTIIEADKAGEEE